MEDRGAPAYVAEFIGTFFLVFFICSVIAVLGGGSGGPDAGGVGGIIVALAVLHAFVLMMLVYTLGGTSGAHFNPAVTVTLAALKKISLGSAAVYILVQLSGGIAGALVSKVIFLDEGKAVHYGATRVSESFLQGKALPGLLCEFIGTFVLMWAIMGTAVNPRGAKEFAGLVIGTTLGFAVMVFGPATGAGFNPARSFGPALVDGSFPDFWIYIVGPLLGALAAGFTYHYLVLAPKGREEVRPIDKLD